MPPNHSGSVCRATPVFAKIARNWQEAVREVCAP